MIFSKFFPVLSKFISNIDILMRCTHRLMIIDATCTHVYLLVYTLQGIHKLNIKGVQMHEHARTI